jgi:transposase InsO family protein
MRRNKRLLERCTGDGRGRKHDGVIVTLKPDLRWCSDCFEIRCWSGERVYVTFVLDCYDREVTGFVAASAPLCGEHVRDMMVQAVDHALAPTRIYLAACHASRSSETNHASWFENTTGGAKPSVERTSPSQRAVSWSHVKILQYVAPVSA